MKGRIQIETISSIVLKNNPLGDPRRREIPVYLPPSYGTARGRRYPVLYYLPGFTGTARSSINSNPWKENVAERFDRLIAQGKAHEAILVIVDGFTAYGGSQYLNSTATGRYEDFTVYEAVGYIDDKHATVRHPEGRAIIGKSSGGFAALTLAMRHPEVYGHCVSHSGDMGFEAGYGTDMYKFATALTRYAGSPKRFVEEFLKSRTKDGFDFGAINLIAMSACYSPNEKSPLGFDLPCDPRTGELVPAVWKRWQAIDPVHAAAKHAGALRRLKTLWFDAGTKDEFNLHLGARRLANAFKALKIRHTHEEHGFGHFDMNARLDKSLPLLSSRCRRIG
ncbi:MAG: esterase [Elusimicrobia bacterium CG11_big_fil_rev_8_21_14_0_20_64_6]|nr:MAG: esterase [Elusimicrobia bacterium CG11_big_fil_rev_8_21_14_0_20_64_6]